MTPGSTTGAEVVALGLREHGIEVAFGLPGVHNLALWPACAAAGVRIVGARHEQGAVYAADGFARATGWFGVALTTTGPGAANTLGAVGEAWASHSAVVVIATDIPSTQRTPGVYRGALHECRDQAAMFTPVTKSSVVVRTADELGVVIMRAARLALTAPQGPVYVEIPTDLLAAAAALPDHRDASLVTQAAVDPILDAIAASSRPLLWVGGGGRDAGAEIDRLATALGAPVITTYQARGVLPADHPLLVAAPPHEPPVTELIARADLAIVIGSDLDAMNTMGWRLPLPEHRVAINMDRADATKSYPMDAVVTGVAAERVALVADAIVARAPWAGDLDALVAALRDELRTTPETRSSMEFVERTEAALPSDAVVFADMCIGGYWLAGHLRVHEPRSLHYPMGWGTLGFAFPASIGAAVAHQATGRPVVSVIGDGGMLFALGELATVAQEGLALTTVVIDDGGYGMLRYGHEGEADLGTELRSPDFAAVARAFGITARAVKGVGADYEAALAEGVKSGEPNLLHVRARLYPPRTTSPRWPLKGG